MLRIETVLSGKLNKVRRGRLSAVCCAFRNKRHGHVCPTGKSPKTCPAPRAKIFRFRRRANQWFLSARLTRQEGRLAIVTNARWDAVDADVTKTNVADADGEVVWS